MQIVFEAKGQFILKNRDPLRELTGRNNTNALHFQFSNHLKDHLKKIF